MKDPKLAIRDLSVFFGHGTHRVQAVRSASFFVPNGESYGIIGESGSGKSTILRAIAGLTDGYEGGVEINGKAVSRRRDKDF